MKLYCAWHKKYFPDECDERGDKFLGEIEPINNPEQTDGLCPRCLKKLKEEIHESQIAIEDKASI